MTAHEKMLARATELGLTPVTTGNSSVGRRPSIYVDALGLLWKYCAYCEDFLRIIYFDRKKHSTNGYCCWCCFHERMYKSLYDAATKRPYDFDKAVDMSFCERHIAIKDGRCFWTNIRFTVRGSDFSESLDRVYNAQDYTTDNVVVSCKWFNCIIKNSRSLEALKKYIEDECLKKYKKDEIRLNGLKYALKMIDRILMNGYRAPVFAA